MRKAPRKRGRPCNMIGCFGTDAVRLHGEVEKELCSRCRRGLAKRYEAMAAKVRKTLKPRTHECTWVPLSFVFETQALGPTGKVLIRQPDLEHGRVYCVCMGCHQHTYVVTKWAGYYLPPPGKADR